MTSLRHHVVAVVAALFALAVGIALGGGPLSDVPDDRPSSATDPTPDDPARRARRRAPDATGEFADAFAASGAARLYADGAARPPDRDPGHARRRPGRRSRRWSPRSRAAGGGITGVFELDRRRLLDPGETSLVDSLGSQLMTQLAELDDHRVDPHAPTYERLGQLLALAIATPDQSGCGPTTAAETDPRQPGDGRAADRRRTTPGTRRWCSWSCRPRATSDDE